MGYAILFISHDKDKTFKRQDGTEFNQIVPTLGNSYNLIIKDMVDIYGYAHLVLKDGEPKRVLTLRSLDGTIDCGSRFKYMQPEINFSYDSLVNALNSAIDEEAKYTGKEFITNERNINPSPKEISFDDLYAECNKMLSSLTKEEQAHYAPYITEITDKYLGKGKKIINITRDQTEQLSLIVFDLKELLKNK